MSQDNSRKYTNGRGQEKFQPFSNPVFPTSRVVGTGLSNMKPLSTVNGADRSNDTSNIYFGTRLHPVSFTQVKHTPNEIRFHSLQNSAQLINYPSYTKQFVPNDLQTLNRFDINHAIYRTANSLPLHNETQLTMDSVVPTPEAIQIHPEQLYVSAGEVSEPERIKRDAEVKAKTKYGKATGQEKKLDVRLKSKYTSKYRGVYWNQRCKAWRCRIWVEKKSEHLGNFDDELSAAIAFDVRSRELGRKKLNFNDETFHKLLSVQSNSKRRAQRQRSKTNTESKKGENRNED